MSTLSGPATYLLVIGLVVLAERVGVSHASSGCQVQDIGPLGSIHQRLSAGKREMGGILWAAAARGTHRAEHNKMAAREEQKWMLQSGSRWLQGTPQAGIPQGRLDKPSSFQPLQIFSRENPFTSGATKDIFI